MTQDTIQHTEQRMTENNVLDQVYKEKQGKLVPEDWDVLRTAMIEQRDKNGVDEHIEENDLQGPVGMSRDEYESLAVQYLEDTNLEALPIPRQTLEEYHAEALHEMTEEQKAKVILDPLDMEPVVEDQTQTQEKEQVQEQEQQDEQEEHGQDSIHPDPEVVQVLDKIVEKSGRADSREDAVRVAAACYEPFTNDDVMKALREIGTVLLKDSNTPQVEKGTEEEIVQYALTALIHTFNQKAEKKQQQNTAQNAADELGRQ